MSDARQKILELQERLAAAEMVRDRQKALGSQENYLEAYSLVESLELQLNRLLAALSADKSEPPARDR